MASPTVSRKAPAPPSKPKAPPKPKPKAPTPAPSRNKSRPAPTPSRGTPSSATRKSPQSATPSPVQSRSSDTRTKNASPAASRGFSGLSSKSPVSSGTGLPASVSRQGPAQGFQSNQGSINSGNVTNSGNYSYTNNSINYNTAVNNVHTHHSFPGPGGGPGPVGPNGFPPGGYGPGGFPPTAASNGSHLSGLRGDAIVNTFQGPDGSTQTQTFHNGFSTHSLQTANGNQLRVGLPNGQSFGVPDRSAIPATAVAQNPTNQVPAGLGTSPADTLVQGQRAITQLQGNIGRLDESVRNFAMDYNNALRTGGQAAADQFLAGVPSAQRDAVLGAGQSMRRLGDLEAAQTAARAGLPPHLDAAGRTAYNDFQRLRGLTASENPTFTDALTAMGPVNGDVHRFGSTDRDRINLGRAADGSEGVTLGDRTSFAHHQRLDMGYHALERAMNNQLYGTPGTPGAMTTQQIQQFNALNGLLTADRSHLPTAQQYDPGVVRVAGTREGQLGGMTSFNRGLMDPLRSGRVNTMAEAVQMAQGRGLRHEDGFGQNMVTSNNLGSLAGQWDRRQNDAMRAQRGVLVAFNPDTGLQQPTMDFINSMQGTYGLNLGTHASGRPNTIQDVQAAIQSGRGGQFGNFHLVSPRTQADLTQAFQGMNGYRERMAYVGAHGNMGSFAPGMAAQQGLQGANDGSVDFGNGGRFTRTQMQNATRGFNGFLFYDTCNGGSLVQAPMTRPGALSPYADQFAV